MLRYRTQKPELPLRHPEQIVQVALQTLTYGQHII